jgi:hypothetical protein
MDREEIEYIDAKIFYWIASTAQWRTSSDFAGLFGLR